MNKEILQGNFKKNKARLRLGLTCFGISLFPKIIISVFRDTMIVYTGIKFFKTLSILTTVFLILGTVGLVCTVGLLVTSLLALKKQEAIEEADSHTGPVLKVKGKLDPVQIKESLISESTNWMSAVSQINPAEAGEMNVALTRVRETMVQMDDYQLRLKTLLDSNGADALRDTEEILDKVEQHICRNVRKLLNIMTVSSPNTQNDVDVVELTARNCAEDNNRLLKTTKEFIVAVTEFLNSQGDSGSSINEIDVYKNALTSQIEEGGIYS